MPPWLLRLFHRRPKPQHVTVTGAIRQDGKEVTRISLFDADGQERSLDITPDTARELRSRLFDFLSH
jgi:translation initiation factor 1 (eIF-1/SUI1)